MRARVGAGLLVAACTLAACDDPVAIGNEAIAPRAVVHAVLDPVAAEQVVLVERSRLGPPNREWEYAPPEDIIVAYGGDPIRGARVVLYDAHGDSAVAIEDAARRPDGLGKGVYRVATTGVAGAAAGLATLAIRPGAAYRLRVETELGTVLGDARVPDAAVAAAPIDLSHDIREVGAEIALPEDVHTHVVSLSTDGTRPRFVVGPGRVVLTDNGLLVWEGNVGRIDFPLSTCESSELSLSAVDANYAAYAQARDRDNLHGEDLRSAGVRGGSGVFGAVVPYARYRINAFSSAVGALDGRWRLDGTSVAGFLAGVTMCLHSPGPTNEVNGLWSLQPGGPTNFVYGGVDPSGTRTVLTLSSTLRQVPPVTLDATLRADTLDGRDTRTGQRLRFIRDRP